jgi:hypothetical protein
MGFGPEYAQAYRFPYIKGFHPSAYAAVVRYFYQASILWLTPQSSAFYDYWHDHWSAAMFLAYPFTNYSTGNLG